MLSPVSSAPPATPSCCSQAPGAPAELGGGEPTGAGRVSGGPLCVQWRSGHSKPLHVLRWVFQGDEVCCYVVSRKLPSGCPALVSQGAFQNPTSSHSLQLPCYQCLTLFVLGDEHNSKTWKEHCCIWFLHLHSTAQMGLLRWLANLIFQTGHWWT